MKLAHLWVPGLGTRLGVLDNGSVVDITAPDQGIASTNDLFAEAARRKASPGALAAELLHAAPQAARYPLVELAHAEPARPHLVMPLHPAEVWACGVTYRKSAEFRDEEIQAAAASPRGMYDYVYSAPRPEIFFKGTASRCVGPYEPICIRSDSTFTAPEPELALVLGEGAQIVGYTLANDVSAWDIERENPLYLPQSKIFRGCCSFGPVIVAADSSFNPLDVTIRCCIERAGRVVFEGEASTARIKRSFDELIEYLTRDNPIPAPTLLLTGTGIIVPPEWALKPGDIVIIEADGIGRIANPVIQL